MEYFLCIEGIGWPSVESDVSQSFKGTVITTADIDGTLATKLGCSVKKGLEPPRSIKEGFDPRGVVYSGGGLDINIINLDGWLDEVIKPTRLTEISGVETAGTISTALTYRNTTVVISHSNPGGTTTAFSAGDTVWVGGREAILLGSAAGGGPVTYSSCTRGYLGTPQGPVDSRVRSVTSAFKWPVGTGVYPHRAYWFDARVIIYAHVPGEPRDNCVRLFTGKLRDIRRTSYGTRYELAATSEIFAGRRKKAETSKNLIVYKDTLVIDPFDPNLIQDQTPASVNDFRNQILRYLQIAYDATAYDQFDRIAIRFLYNYRCLVGGTAGAIAADSYAPQAPISTVSVPYGGDGKIYSIDSLVNINGYYVRAMRKRVNVSSLVKLNLWHIITESANEASGRLYPDPFDRGSRFRILVDNIGEGLNNRFLRNGFQSRHPIDIALHFMTSFDDEFWIGEAIAGGTTTVANFNAPGWTADEWVGYTLYCALPSDYPDNGISDNEGEARTIVDNDASSITVDTPFSTANHNGYEYHIRNSQYDTLPQGFGLGIRNDRIDISSWEAVRDQHLPGHTVGDFAIGDKDEIDIWNLLEKNVFQTYSVLPYIDRTTGKLSAKYIGETEQDGLLSDYVAVSDDNLLPGSFDTIEIIPRLPVTRIKLTTRTENLVAIRPIYTPIPGTAGYNAGGITAQFNVDYEMGTTYGLGNSDDGADTYIVRTPADELSLGDDGSGELSIDAMLSDTSNISKLVTAAVGRVRRLSKPPPESDVYLDISMLPKVQAGTTLSVTTTIGGVVDPYLGTAGMTNRACLVLSCESILHGSQMGLRCRVQIKNNITAAKIAPACIVTSKTSGPPHYFTIDPDVFTDDPSDYDNLDWTGLAVNDVIDHRSKLGAIRESGLTIASFGTNQSSTPEGADSYRINVTTDPANAVNAGDFITLADWGSATTNMKTYSYWADSANEELGAAGDDPKTYL